MTLLQLANLILALDQHPIRRIRLAKLIYFTHKELIRKGIMQPDDITYLRMPLGPTPIGLVSLTEDSDGEIYSTKVPTPILTYESEEFSTKLTLQAVRQKALKASQIVEKFLPILNKKTTSELIKLSQRDPSWRTHHNGEHFTITSNDLKNPLPRFQLKINIVRHLPHNEAEAIQAALLRGMKPDIIEESTDLEYPDEN